MPIVKNAEQIGTMTLEDGRVIPRYNVKTETTLTNTETGQEKIRRDVKVFAPSLRDMLGQTPKE
jgi:hypothetical protein